MHKLFEKKLKLVNLQVLNWQFQTIINLLTVKLLQEIKVF